MKLTVQNFQIHRENSVEIPEGETTYLEGDSDIGKSAMLRALRWVCENKPDGGSFVTFKSPRGTNSKVTLELDGRTVTRERGKSKNTYGLDSEVFEAFGRNVPEPVAKFLNLSPYAFQLQGEVSFLIGASPTEAAKILSDACGLGVIDTAVAFARNKKTVADADIRKCEILLDSAQRRLDDADKELPAADALERAADLGEETEVLESRRQALSDAIDDEPGGEVLDIAAAQASVALARSAEVGVKDLLGRAAALRKAIADAPKGELYDIAAAKEKMGEARVIGAWLADVGASALRLRQAIDDAPRGGAYDLGPVAKALEAARAVESEVTMLVSMSNSIRDVLAVAPKGDLLDTSELEKQRAQIKVCPTCGREL